MWRSARASTDPCQGLPVDQAVSAGRLAILNLGGADDQDWGVPVLYLQTEADVAFAPMKQADSGTPTVKNTDPSNGKTDIARNLREVRIKFTRPMTGYSLTSPTSFGPEQVNVMVSGDTCTITRKTRIGSCLPTPALSSR